MGRWLFWKFAAIGVVSFILGLAIMGIIGHNEFAFNCRQLERQVDNYYYQDGQDYVREAIEIAKPHISSQEYGRLCFEAGRIRQSSILDPGKDPYDSASDVESAFFKMSGDLKSTELKNISRIVGKLRDLKHLKGRIENIASEKDLMINRCEFEKIRARPTTMPQD